jgi:pSer/pThr/pTyr-binding forkhead associated (FHA) protein
MSALRFKHVSVPRQQGEQARLKVVQGPDFGAIFVVTGTQTTLGRGEENEIMLSDLKTSRRHAEFSQTANGWNVKDTGSANGLLHNGKATRNAMIKSGDTLTFGETTLEFMTAESATLMLVAPPKSAGQFQLESATFDKQKKKIQSLGKNAGGAGAAAGKLNPRVLLYGVVGVGLVFFLMMEPDAPTSGKGRKVDPNATEDLNKFLPGSVEDPSTAKATDQFFKVGFREYMAHNYLRAKTQFETVLQMAPGHALAKLYLANCEKQISDDVQIHLDQGKKAMDAGRLRDARGHFEAVLRTLFRDQASPDYIVAKEQLEKVNKEMSGREGAKP